jgi:hypothetical protein
VTERAEQPDAPNASIHGHIRRAIQALVTAGVLNDEQALKMPVAA